MFRFIKKLVFISIFPLVSIVIFDVWLRAQPSSYTEKYDMLVEHKNDVELLVVGNSHASYAIDPSAFKKKYVHNLANVSQKIYFDKRITLNALRNYKFPKLKYVLISVDYHSLFTSTQGVRDIWSYYSSGIRYKNKNYFLADLSPFLWGYSPKVAFSFLKKHILAKSRYLDTENAIDQKARFYRGFLPLLGADNGKFNEENYKKEISNYSEPQVSERKNVVRDLRGFIKELKKRKITPILITAPTYREYNKFLNKEILKKNLSDISKITLDFNILYWNFMDDERFVKDDFYNADHLNAVGARKFSSFLQKKIEKLQSIIINY